MSDFLNSLPKPEKAYRVVKSTRTTKIVTGDERNKAVPPYGRRAEQHFVPRKQEDYGDGGAFPEIHVAQYPLGMGRQAGTTNAGGSVVPVSVAGETGVVEYDAIFKQGRSQGDIVNTKFTDIIESNNLNDESLLKRPDEEELRKTAEATRAALMGIVEKKVAMAKPVKYGNANATSKAQYIRYTPREDAPGYNPNIKQRIVKVVEAQVDPMEPPKFKFRKAPRAPPSAPVPVLHSPPRKLTAEDHKNWKIPPCISNWKNSRGYTIALDKRLAADGRNLKKQTINGGFAKLAESLLIAERKARIEVETRAALARKSRQSEKSAQEEELRNIAEQARMAHNSLRTGGGGRASASSRGRSRDEGSRSGSSGESGSGSSSSGSSSSGSDSSGSDDDDDESAARARRDELRAQRKRERERDLRLESKGKRSKTQRDLDRDVSERIALGMPTGKQRRETKYDTRLFNQSSGMNAGFGKDDEYNLYSKPLFDKSKGDSIYRPRTSDKNVYGTVEEHYDKIKNHGEKFRPDQDFKGVSDARSRGPRSEPVQFERSGSNSGTGEQQEDPFGLDSFLTEAKQGKKKRRGILEDRGSGRGVMSASGGSALRSAKDDDDSWRKRKMEFTRGSG